MPLEKEDLHQLLAALIDHLGSRQPVTHVDRPVHELVEAFAPFGDPLSGDEVLQQVKGYLNRCTKLHSPQYIGHQTSVPSFETLAADMIHGATNNSAAVYDMAPAGSAIEAIVVRWMLEKVGWTSEEAAGVLVLGGSIANLTGLLAARARKMPDSWEEGVAERVAIFVPDISHYSVSRAVSVLGLGQRSLVPLPTDGHGRIFVANAREVIDRTIRQGIRPIALCANAGSTLTGNYDPIAELRALCDQHELWLHVDGAHGASALVSSKYRSLVDDLRFADSLVWDAHKLLGCSSLCTGLLFREKENMSKIFSQSASYLGKHQGGSFPFTIECTKPAIGMKLFLMIHSRGEVGLEQHVTHLLDMSRQFYEQIQSHPDFESPVRPDTNIILFRHKNADEHRSLYERVLKSGAFHITFAEYRGEQYLRLTVMNPKTTADDIDRLLSWVSQAVTQSRRVGEGLEGSLGQPC